MTKHKCHARLPKRAEINENPVRLCHEISHLSRNILRATRENDEVLSAHGTRLVISHLAVCDGVTQLDLVNATYMKAPTISVILKNLEEAGIVERRRDEKDLRILRVYLTDKGRQIDRCNIERVKETDKVALFGISDSEHKELMRLLTMMRNNLLEKTEDETQK